MKLYLHSDPALSLSPMSAEQWGCVWADVTVRIQDSLFVKGHGGLAER